MERLKRAYWWWAHRCARPGSKLWYRADSEIYLKYREPAVPAWIYRPLYWVGLNLCLNTPFKHTGDWLVHRIPYNVRFKLA